MRTYKQSITHAEKLDIRCTELASAFFMFRVEGIAHLGNDWVVILWSYEEPQPEFDAM